MYFPRVKAPASRFRIEIELMVNGVLHTVDGGVDPFGFEEIRDTYLAQHAAGNDTEFNYNIQYVN